MLRGTPRRPCAPAPARPSSLPSALALLAVVVLAVAPGGTRAQASAPQTLRLAAEASGRYFGAAIDQSRLSDAVYATIAAREFDLATPESELAFATVEPQQSSFDFSRSDRVFNWAVAHGLRFRGFPMLQPTRLPTWLTQLSGSRLRGAMLSHVQNLAMHYRGKVAYWDVVNEAFNEDGSRRQGGFQVTGDDWIQAAFQTARATDPSAKLCYTDYNLEAWSYPKTQAVYRLVKDFKARGVPIDCVGLEGRFVGEGATVPTTLRTTLDQLAALGVEVMLTQVEVEKASPTGYAALTSACVAVPKCSGITVWGVLDRATDWRQVEGTLLFDYAGNKKPAYSAVLEALSGTCCGTTYPLTVTRGGTGGGTVTSSSGGIACGASCSARFASGTAVTLTATPGEGSAFAGWSGACTGTGTCVVTMTAERAVEAAFDTSPATPDTLRGAAEASGRYFGTSIYSASKLSDAVFTAVVPREFDMLTPENALTLDATEPQLNTFTFAQADTIVAWAQTQGLRVRGQPLLWHSAGPSWLVGLSGSALRAAMLNHVEKVVAHFQGKIAYWDVVSEAFEESGTRRQSTLQSTGDDWIEAAFQTARAADPAARLCYSDYNLESWTYAKTQAVYEMVKDFKARGVPIDCVGFQGHFTGGATVPSSLETTLASFAALGVDVALTEVDVTNADAAKYAALTRACMNVARCVGITVWGFRDPESWRSSEVPLLFDRDGNAKPAYAAVLEAMGAAGPGTTHPLTVSIAGTGGGTVTSSAGGISCGTACAAILDSGTTVTLTATADARSAFAGWSGACTGTGPCVVTMTSALSVGATFDARPTTPCDAPVTFTGSTGGFGTTGAVCYRTATTVRGWGCSSFDGRTVSVNGGTPAATCGGGPLPLAPAPDGYTYFTVTGGAYPWATLFVWTW